MYPVKISSLELENVKRIKAVQITPTADGLTVIGGRNAQGKSSVLDAIAWALGGNKLKPANPNRDGGATPAKLHVELSNGIVVERRGKNGTLYVTDTMRKKGTQKLLDEFLSQLALDLRKFMAGSDKDKATALLQTLGIDRELAVLDGKIQNVFDERRDQARIAKRDKAYADGLSHHDDAPDEPVSVSELTEKLQVAIKQNAENARKRRETDQLLEDHAAMRDEIERMRHALAETEKRYQQVETELSASTEEIRGLVDIDTSEIEASIANIETINAKVSDNQRWTQATETAKESAKKQRELDKELKTLRESRTALLDGAPLPLEGLAIDGEGRMTYNGQVWSDMSGAEQLRVATAIVQATKPDCGFVLVDELEKFDGQQLAEFGSWAQERGLQVIGTRVGTDDACTIIIEDGKVDGQDLDEPTAPDPRGEALEWESEPKPEAANKKTWGGASF